MDKNKDGVVTLEEFVVACQEVRVAQAAPSLSSLTIAD